MVAKYTFILTTCILSLLWCLGDAIFKNSMNTILYLGGKWQRKRELEKKRVRESEREYVLYEHELQFTICES